MSNQVDQIKQKIVDGMKILLRDGLMELNTGHLSVRVPGKDLICMPGHLHDQARTLDTLIFDDIITIDMEGNKVEGELSAVGERFIHTKIYAARPDVGSVIHCHPQLATCFSIAGVKIFPVYHRAAIFHPGVPIWDYPGQIDKPELGQQLAEALGKGPAILVRGHGAVTVGESPEACVAICAILRGRLRCNTSPRLWGHRGRSRQCIWTAITSRGRPTRTGSKIYGVTRHTVPGFRVRVLKSNLSRLSRLLTLRYPERKPGQLIDPSWHLR